MNASSSCCLIGASTVKRGQDVAARRDRIEDCQRRLVAIDVQRPATGRSSTGNGFQVIVIPAANDRGAPSSMMNERERSLFGA